MQKFKVGDKVRRKFEEINAEWSQFMSGLGYQSTDAVVVSCDSESAHSIYISGVGWDPSRFDLVESKRSDNNGHEYTIYAQEEYLPKFSHNGRQYTLISKDVPTAGVIVGYYNDTKEVFVVEPEFDWSTVAIDTKIYVRDTIDDMWTPAYFAKNPPDGGVKAFAHGKTSFTTSTLTWWKHAKLA